MCDSANTTDIIESECWLCPDAFTCNTFSKSYLNRCNWKGIATADRCVDSGKCDGICTDALLLHLRRWSRLHLKGEPVKFALPRRRGRWLSGP